MKNLNNVHMTAHGAMVSVGWKDDAGNRMHVWLAIDTDERGNSKRDANDEVVVKRPFEVKCERSGAYSTGRHMRQVYKNPPLKADGSALGRRDEGYFKTRYLDAESKAWREIVAEALRIADVSGMLEQARQAEKDNEAARETKQRQERVDRIRKGIADWQAEEPSDVATCRALIALMAASDDDLLKVARWINRH